MMIEIDTNRTNQVTLCRDRRGYKMNKIIILKIGNKDYIVIKICPSTPANVII